MWTETRDRHDFASLGHHFFINNIPLEWHHHPSILKPNVLEAGQRIFRRALLNNWSTRDIQGLESSLGRLKGKVFGTTISPIVTLDALAEPRVSLRKHLQDVVDFNNAIRTKVDLEHDASTALLSEPRA
ncbi:hypothetical protein IFM47457_00898 [Aspergillus lentulus]|nr:hypothetical protein IFM47457_00898 [Aspergillus lentulus]